MAQRIARRRRVRRWLVPAIVSGMLLAGCSGGSGAPSSDDGIDPPGDPGGAPGPGTPGSPPDGPGTATGVVLRLSWVPSIDPVDGYVIYYGFTPEAVDKHFVTLSVAELANPEAPAYSLNAGLHLGLNQGDSICFRLTSYKNTDESAPSEAVCDTI